MDKIVSKIVGLGVPGLILLVAISIAGPAGGAAITVALSSIGPGGMVAGVITLVFIGLIADAIASFGFEAIFKGVMTEFYKRGETREQLIAKVKGYKLLSKGIKLKVIGYIQGFDETESGDGLSGQPGSQ